MREWKRLSDHHSNSVYQLALMGWIESKELERHIRRMKKVYQNRRDLLIKLMMDYFGDRVTIHGGGAGMHIVAEFEGAVFSEEQIRKLLQAGVYVVPVERHSLTKGDHRNQIILGYASLTEEDMKRGLDILKEIMM
jgi:GntR family transcriptional regulator/MocR family aminotransferase